MAGAATAGLVIIATTGRESLAEMRRPLGLTRPDSVELIPLPGLADLPSLVERSRAANLPVSLTATGDTITLPPARSFPPTGSQEALNNTLRHAGPNATAAGTIYCGPSTVEIDVTDTGHGAHDSPDTQLTNGIRGMRVSSTCRRTPRS